MKRIKITCCESDKNTILGAFDNLCPFSPYTDICGEGNDDICRKCLEQNIEFIIISRSDNRIKA